MSIDTPQPLGFPRCRYCPLLQTGPAEVCYRCASATFERAASPCPVCSRQLGDDGSCGNPLCNDSSRSIERIAAVAIKTGAIDDRIQELKYQGQRGWAPIFGRIVLGYLQAHRQPGEFGLIVANPTYVGTGSGTRVNHTELVIEAAAREDLLGIWPWDTTTPRAITKTGPSLQSAGGRYAQKREAAGQLLAVLAIPDPTRTAGKRILVYDDICTTGLQLDRVAWFLTTRGGAVSVEALVLARARYRGT
jgi:predicted amidophosphoribosyltransferase